MTPQQKFIIATIKELAKSGSEEFRPGDIASLLRKKNQPIALWSIRATFTDLTELGLIKFNPKYSFWHL
tara:strand:+ start:238 stop:444 length:207 start_codon:yes stop_codon:yes gene_type:complete